MGYQAIIFDLDGVLCHTDEYHYQAWKAMADGLGVYFDPEINNRLRGVSRMDSLEIILEQYNGPELNQAEKLALAEKKKVLWPPTAMWRRRRWTAWKRPFPPMCSRSRSSSRKKPVRTCSAPSAVSGMR